LLIIEGEEEDERCGSGKDKCIQSIRKVLIYVYASANNNKSRRDIISLIHAFSIL